MLTLILLLTFCTAGLVGYLIVPDIVSRVTIVSEQRQKRYAVDMEQMISRQEAKKMSRMFIIAPPLFAFICFLLFPEGMKLFGSILGFVGGFVFPGTYISILTKRTRDKFSDQLIDALMIMSSSFRGGLSLVQAMEAVVEEMPDPINKEFGTVLGENKMGVSLEEALQHMYTRMPMPSLQQMITAILLARETGGNLPVIFSRIATTIRENKKIQQNINTLTVQGKIQGVVMSVLPIAFGYIVYTSNRKVFEHMFHSETGRGILMYATVSWLIGVYMIWKISRLKEF